MLTLLFVGHADAQGTTVTTELTFSAEDLRIFEQGEYDIVSYRGAIPDWSGDRVGQPQLPVVIRRFLLPPETRIERVDVTVLRADTLDGRYLPQPIQPDPARPTPFVPPDPVFYGSNDPYPETPAWLLADGYFRTYHGGTVKIFPLQYVGNTEQLILLRRAQVTVTVGPLPAEASARLFRRLRQDHRPWAERPESRWLRHLVVNPEGLGQYYVPTPQAPGPSPLSVEQNSPFGGFQPTEFPSLEGPPVQYVVITDSVDVFGVPLGGTMVTAFEDLADWKTNKGCPAVVRTVSWIQENYAGTDTPEKIRAFIKDAAARWGTDYVVLGGDFGIVPLRLLGGIYSDLDSLVFRPDPPADMYYGELDQTWNTDRDAYYAEWDAPEDTLDMSRFEYMDIWVGRLPVRDTTEVRSLVEKILTYERAPGAVGSPASSYYNNVLMVAGPTNYYGESTTYNGLTLTESSLVSTVNSSAFAMDVTRLYAVPPDDEEWCSDPYPGQNLRCYEYLYDLLGGVTYDPFTATNLRNELNTGHAFVWHVEHSERDKLGGLSFTTDVKDLSCPDQSWQTACFNAFKNANPGYGPDLHADMVDRLTNGPNYSVVLSGGSQTNMWDLDAVGEHFLRAPDGGAIAYFGKTASYVGPCYWIPAEEFFLNVFDRDVIHLGEATGQATNASPYPTGAGVTWTLLGDPELPLWTQAPGQLAVTVMPSSFPMLGPQTITVVVKESGTSNDIEGARVCLRQGDGAYAVAWTDSKGTARFPSFSPSTTDTIKVVATARNYVPGTGSCPHSIIPPIPAYVAYAGHEYDDSGTGGDDDEIVDAGELVEMTVSAKNQGTSTASGVVAFLWANGPVLYDLDLEGDSDRSYEPENIYIGSLDAHPHPSWIGDTLHIPAMGDTFRLPANWEAIRAEGEPSPSTTRSHFRVWRDTTAAWHVVANRGASDADSIFTGILLTEGGFSSVSCEAETGTTDSWYFEPSVNPDSIWFEFVIPIDDDPDVLTFRAEAGDWVEVQTDSVTIGTIAGGSDEDAVFDVEWTTEVPDHDEAVFTLAVHDAGWNWWYSDFSQAVHAPQVRQSTQRVLTRYNGAIYTAKIWPRIANTGSADADTVHLIMSNMTGASFTVADTEVVFTDVGPDTTVKVDSLYLQSYTDFFTSLRYDIEVRTHYPNGDWASWSRSSVDIVAPDPPTDVIVDELGEGAVLRWTPADDSSIEGYHVYQYLPGDTTRLTLDPLTTAARFEIGDRETFDGSGDYIHYRYGIVSADSVGNQSTWAVSDTALVWLPEATGWPRYMNTGSTCAARALDMETKTDPELEILAAGKAIYAWNHDGTPLISGNPDGLFFDPGTDAQVSVDADTVHALFAGALAIADLDADGLLDVVGNLSPLGVYRIEYDPDSETPVQKRWFRSLASSYKAPTVEDLDGDGNSEVILLGDNDSLYVWTHDGNAYANPSMTHGRFAQTPFGTQNNFQTVAVGEANLDHTGKEIFMSMGNDNRRPRVACYASDDSSLVWHQPIGDPADESPASGPVLGDVDADGSLEVVVARGIQDPGGAVTVAGGFWALDDSSGTVEQSVTSDAFRIRGETKSLPPAAVTLGELRNGDSGLEMIAGGGQYGENLHDDDEMWARDVRLHVWSGGSDTTSATDSVMIPGRKVPHSHAVTQAILANLDDDANIELLVGMNSSYLACFEWDSVGATARRERGWPQLFPDLPSEPCVADVDQSGNLELVVADGSGAVHVFELPGDADGAALPWPQYGHDERSTFNAATTGSSEGGRGPGPGGRLLSAVPSRWLTIGPNPQSAVSWATFEVVNPGPVKLEIFDVQGRRVRRLLDQDLDRGRYKLAWDGKTDQGQRAGKGIFLFRLTMDGRSLARKVSVVQ